MKALKHIDLLAAEEAASREELTRAEYGSVEGAVVSLKPYYGKPAVMIRERLSGEEVPCVLSQGDEKCVGEKRKWWDVWSNRRVLITGKLHFNKFGQLKKIDAVDVNLIRSRSIPVGEI